MIDVRRLQVLRVLHAQGSVGATARQLRLTPSAVSQQLRQLSEELGVPLLRREGRRVFLTAQAQTLIRHADMIFSQWENAVADLSASDEQRGGTLRLAGFPTALGAILAPAAVAIRELRPQLTVTVTEAETTHCFDLLLNNAVDIALVVPLPGNPTLTDPRFEQVPLLDDVQDLVVPRDHPLAGRSAVHLREASAESWIAAPGVMDQHQLIYAACAFAGFAPRITHHALEWNAICALVGHGLGVCLVPRLAAIPPSLGVVRVPVEPPPIRRVSVCLRRGSRSNALIDFGIRAIGQVAKPEPGEAGVAGHPAAV